MVVPSHWSCSTRCLYDRCILQSVNSELSQPAVYHHAVDPWSRVPLYLMDLGPFKWRFVDALFIPNINPGKSCLVGRQFFLSVFVCYVGLIKQYWRHCQYKGRLSLSGFWHLLKLYLQIVRWFCSHLREVSFLW